MPLSQRLVREGIVFHMDEAVHEVDFGEADRLLRSMLAEVSDSDSAALGEALAGAAPQLRADAIAVDPPEWVARMGQDFALAAAAFWLDYCDRQQAATSAAERGVTAPGLGDPFADFALLASRFYVVKAHVLWTELHRVRIPAGLAEPAAVQRALTDSEQRALVDQE